MTRNWKSPEEIHEFIKELGSERFTSEYTIKLIELSILDKIANRKDQQLIDAINKLEKEVGNLAEKQIHADSHLIEGIEKLSNQLENLSYLLKELQEQTVNNESK